MSHFRSSGHMILCHLDAMVDGGGIHVHGDLPCRLLLCDDQVHGAVNHLPWVDVLHGTLLPHHVQVVGQAVLVVVWDTSPLWLDGFEIFLKFKLYWVSFDASNAGEKHRVVILLDNGHGLVLVLLLDLFGPALGGVHGEPTCTELLWQASLF